MASMKVNKMDKLFALKCLEKKVKSARERYEGECKLELARAYEEEGTTQRRSPLFGKEAGTFSYIPPKIEEKTEYKTDMTAVVEFLTEEPKAAEMFILANPGQFYEFWVEQTGEIPGGITRSTYEVEKPGSTRLAVKEDIVFEQLSSTNLLEDVNQLLLGDGNE